MLILALLLVRTLAQSHLRRTGTNNLPPVAELAVAPAATSCQTEALVPGDTGNVTFGARASGSAPTTVRLSLRGSAGTVAAPTAMTYVFMRLSPSIAADRRDVDVCFTNEGTQPLVLYGAAPPDGTPVRVRVDWYRPAAQRNLTMGSTVADRFALQKAPFLGPWTFWLAAALVLALSLAALVWMLRGVEE